MCKTFLKGGQITTGQLKHHLYKLNQNLKPILCCRNYRRSIYDHHIIGTDSK